MSGSELTVDGSHAELSRHVELTQKTAAERGVPWRNWHPAPVIRMSFLLHAAAAGSLLWQWENWPWAFSAMAANHAGLTAAVMVPQSELLGPNMTRLAPDRAALGHVALTFDDGPDPGVTPYVLDVLDRHGATASFFCIGELAERHPALVREIARRGHQVENHTHGHLRVFACLGPSAMRRQVLRAQEVLADLTGRRPVYFRAPMGLRSPLLDAALADTGLRHVAWTRRGFDTSRADPASVLRRLCRSLSGGDILALHDGSSAPGPNGTPLVLAVLPSLLRTISAHALLATSLAMRGPTG